ncbi:hypothetical protein FS749_001998 [Ceratobasidium sp. UAMH 11750]|nr:hypothetical protein FS749_001998 [Ceratobasidium sp. UAMH 11750]
MATSAVVYCKHVVSSEEVSLRLLCSVPLDYQNGTSGHANLSVGRLLAKNTTARLGSLFINPGGPGGSGLSFLYRAGPALAELLDDRYDIVSWDPRGINGTT